MPPHRQRRPGAPADSSSRRFCSSWHSSTSFITMPAMVRSCSALKYVAGSHPVPCALTAWRGDHSGEKCRLGGAHTRDSYKTAQGRGGGGWLLLVPDTSQKKHTQIKLVCQLLAQKSRAKTSKNKQKKCGIIPNLRQTPLGWG